MKFAVAPSIEIGSGRRGAQVASTLALPESVTTLGMTPSTRARTRRAGWPTTVGETGTVLVVISLLTSIRTRTGRRLDLDRRELLAPGVDGDQVDQLVDVDPGRLDPRRAPRPRRPG